MAIGTTLFIFAAIVAALAAAVYFVGIPAEWKQKIAQEYIENMGESKAKDMMKDQLDKLPEADRQKAEAMSSGIASLTGGDLNNPLGKFGKKKE